MASTENRFWRLCRWAAIGLLVLLAIWAFQIALGQTGRLSFAIGSSGGKCAFDKGFLVCSGFPGAQLLTYVFLLPPAVFLGAPMLLLASLNPANWLNATAPLAGFGVFAVAWLLLGTIGVIRAVLSLSNLTTSVK